MCAGAIHWAGIPAVVAAAPEVLTKSLILNPADYPAAVDVVGHAPEQGIEAVTSLERYVTQGDLRFDAKSDSVRGGIVLGWRLANRLSVYVGDLVDLVPPTAAKRSRALGVAVPQLWQFEVTGLFDTGMYQYDDGFAIMSLATAQQFAEDIQRHLDGLPVRARADTFGYRTGKFIRRHKLGATAAAVITLTLLIGIVATVWQAQVARAERARAERRFNEVRQLANSFVFEVHDAVVNLPGSTTARSLIVQRGLKYLDSLAQDAAGDRGLQRELAVAYEKLGAVQYTPSVAHLGRGRTHDHGANLIELRLHRWVRQRLHGVAMDFPDDIGGRFAWRE